MFILLLIIIIIINLLLIRIIFVFSKKQKEMYTYLAALREQNKKLVERESLIFQRPFNFELDFFGMKYIGNSDNHIDVHVLKFGAYEKDIILFMRDVILSLASNDSIVIDVGANKGHHSLFISQYANKVLSIEPYQPLLASFRTMIELNNIENIIIHSVGLGEKEGTVSFNEPPPTNLGMGTFLKNSLTDGAKTCQLQIVTGDKLLRQYNLTDIHLVKIDTEGYEKPVLSGMKNILNIARPIVIFEISIDSSISESFKDMEELRNTFPDNYEFSRFVQEDKNRMTGQYELIPFEADFGQLDRFNMLAYPRERSQHIKMNNS